MSNTLSDIRADILDFINRPQSESQDRVDRAINRAINHLQLRHQFVFAERMVRLVYPAGTLLLNVADLLGGKPRDIFSCEVLGTIESTTGKSISIKKLVELKAKNHKFQKTHYRGDYQEENNNSITELEFMRSNQDYCVFLTEGKLGIFPTPTSDVNLLCCFHLWFDNLVEDDDTNFFLDFCDNFIILKALYQLNTLLKSESRNQINALELTDAFDACLNWDSQVSNSPGETI